MRSGAKLALIVTALFMLASAVITGAFAFFSWAVAMNGFMGQDRAVNASITLLAVLSVLAAIVGLVLSMVSVYYLSVKRVWNAALAATLSVVLFAAVTGGLQLLSVIVSVVVADQMRTNR